MSAMYARNAAEQRLTLQWCSPVCFEHFNVFNILWCSRCYCLRWKILKDNNLENGKDVSFMLATEHGSLQAALSIGTDQIEKVRHSALLKKFADFQTSQFRNWSRLAISAKSSPSGFDVSDCSNSLWRPLESNESQLGWQWLKHVETPLSPFQRTLLPGPTARPQGVWGTGHFETSLRCWAAFLSVKRDRVHQHQHWCCKKWVLDTDLWCNSIGLLLSDASKPSRRQINDEHKKQTCRVPAPSTRLFCV